MKANLRFLALTGLTLLLAGATGNAQLIFVQGDPDESTILASLPLDTNFNSFTRIFADESFAGGNNNHGRGSVFVLGENPNGDEFRVDSIMLRKNTPQSFTNSTLTLTLFEGTAEQWDMGDGDNDGDFFNGTGITNVILDAEPFALSGEVLGLDLMVFQFSPPLMLAENSDYGFLVQYTPDVFSDPFVQVREFSGGGGQTRMLGDSQEVRIERATDYFVIGEAVGGGFLLGDVNQDGAVDLLDVGPFVELLANNGFQLEADIDGNGMVDLLDVGPFVDLLSGG